MLGDLSPLERRRLELYLHLLYRAGASLNLTRVAPEFAWQRHIEESLSLLELARWSRGAVVADLGSGGGLPGIPLAVVRPEVRFLLLERTEKKAEFLRATLAELGLENVQVLAAEARECPHRQGWRPLDYVVSRAAGRPPQVVPSALGLLRQGGEALLVVGRGTVLTSELARIARGAGGGAPALVRAGPVTVIRVRRQS